MAKKTGSVIGGWAFLVGVVLAVILGLIGQLNATMITVLVVIGLLVGLLNVTGRETSSFLMAGAVLIIATSLGRVSIGVIPRLLDVVDALLLIFVPATVIVAIKHAFALAKN